MSERDVYKSFRYHVLNGKITDPYGNNLKIYQPRSNSFFACLSYARYGTSEKRKEIRENLLKFIIKTITNIECKSVNHWTVDVNSAKMHINDNCINNLAVDALSVALGGPKSKSDRKIWVKKHSDFREGLMLFVCDVLDGKEAHFKYVLSYAWIQVYKCDIFFFEYNKQRKRVKLSNKIRQREKFTLVEVELPDSTSNEDNYDSNNNNRKKTRMSIELPRKIINQAYASLSSSSSSVESQVNWFCIYLLFVESNEKGDSFELLYTTERTHYDRTMKRYCVRQYIVEGNRRKNIPLRADGAKCLQPQIGRKVHRIDFAPNEISNSSVFQVAPTNKEDLLPSQTNNLKNIKFIYLRYKSDGDRKTDIAYMTCRVESGKSAGYPTFIPQTVKYGKANGMYFVESESDNDAHEHVEIETNSVVEIPGLHSSDFAENDENTNLYSSESSANPFSKYSEYESE